MRSSCGNTSLPSNRLLKADAPFTPSSAAGSGSSTMLFGRYAAGRFSFAAGLPAAPQHRFAMPRLRQHTGTAGTCARGCSAFSAAECAATALFCMAGTSVPVGRAAAYHGAVCGFAGASVLRGAAESAGGVLGAIAAYLREGSFHSKKTLRPAPHTPGEPASTLKSLKSCFSRP